MNNSVQTTTAPSPANRTGANGAQREQQQPYVVPPVDVYENDASITLLADLPGVTREQLNIRVNGEALVLEATAAAAGPENMQLVHGEAQCPSYRRQFTLSRELDTTRIEAQLKDGVLRLTIPKAEDARPRRIEVQPG